jgi:hypothetical protein
VIQNFSTPKVIFEYFQTLPDDNQDFAVSRLRFLWFQAKGT